MPIKPVPAVARRPGPAVAANPVPAMATAGHHRAGQGKGGTSAATPQAIARRAASGCHSHVPRLRLIRTVVSAASTRSRPTVVARIKAPGWLLPASAPANLRPHRIMAQANGTTPTSTRVTAVNAVAISSGS
jgi:hypothetical protein